MKLVATFTVLLTVAIVSSHAFQCSSLLPAKICSKIDTVGDAMSVAVAEANKALVDAVKEASTRATDVYKAGLTLIKDRLKAEAGKLTGKLNSLKALLDDKLAALSKLQKDVIDKAIKEIEAAHIKLAAAIQNAVASAKPSDAQATSVVASAFAISDVPDGSSNAMATCAEKLRSIIATAVREADEVVRKMKTFVESLLKTLGGSSKDAQFFDDQAGYYLNTMEYQVTMAARDRSALAVAQAVNKAVELFDELQTSLRVTRRSAGGIWAKVQASLKTLGTSITDKVKKVFEEKKPEIMKALQNVGKVLIDTGKKILIEISKDIVTAIITSSSSSTTPTITE